MAQGHQSALIVLSLAAASVGATGCKSEQAATEAAAPAAAPEKAAPEAQAKAAQPRNGARLAGDEAPTASPADNVQVLQDALQSAADALGHAPTVQAASGSLLARAARDGAASACFTETALPRSGDPETGDYAGAATYCDLAATASGVHTVQGALARLRGFLCAAQSHLHFDGRRREAPLVVDKSCFSQEFLDMTAVGESLARAKIQVVAREGVDPSFGAPEYQRGIRLKGDFDLDYKVTLTQTGSVLALAAQGGVGAAAQEGDVFAVSLDTARGLLRFEARFYVADHDGAHSESRHVRGLFQGFYNQPLRAFSEIDHAAYLRADSLADGSVKAVSLKGASQGGFFATSTVAKSRAAEVPYPSASFCYGDSGCAAFGGLAFATDGDVDFLRTVDIGETGAVSAADWFKGHGPLRFDEVTTAGEQD